MQNEAASNYSVQMDLDSVNSAVKASQALHFDEDSDLSRLESVWDIALDLDGELTKLYNYLSALCEPALPGLKGIRLSRAELSAAAEHLCSENPLNEDLSPLPKAKFGLFRILKSQQIGDPLTLDAKAEITRSSQLLDKGQAEFSALRHKLSRIISKYAPNLCKLVEQSTALDLLIHYGGLKRLSCASASNMHTVGSITSESGKELNCSLSRDELLAGISRQNKLKSVRALAGKAVLAARVDMAQTSPDGSKGAEWKAGVLKRLLAIDKVPESIIQRALPIPKDPVRNKRGGRRINRAAKLSAAQQNLRNKTIEFAKFR